jgi:hypothetical protein
MSCSHLYQQCLACGREGRSGEQDRDRDRQTDRQKADLIEVMSQTKRTGQGTVKLDLSFWAMMPGSRFLGLQSATL